MFSWPTVLRVFTPSVTGCHLTIIAWWNVTRAAKGKKLVSIADALEMQQSNLPMSSDDEEDELDLPTTPDLDKSKSAGVEGEEESASNHRQRRSTHSGAHKVVRAK
eukprot:837925-Pyramimonas_sp.AAC.1